MQERIEVVVDSSGVVRGGRVIRTELGKIGGTADRTTSHMDLLRRAVLAVTAGMGIRQISQWADEWMFAQNRIRVVTQSTKELGTVTGALFQIAQRTRGAFTSVAEVYERMARNATELGLSQQDMAVTTKAISQAIAVSGVSARTASMALIQLGQAFASGVLRGDELRSVMEQMPRLSRAIAIGMNSTIGQLRTLGQEGKLTALEVINAIKSQSDAINKDFMKIAPTIGQMMQVLTNSVARFIGEFGQTSGIIDLITSSFRYLSYSIDSITNKYQDAARDGLGHWILAVRNWISVNAVFLRRVATLVSVFATLRIAITAVTFSLGVLSSLFSMSIPGAIALIGSVLYTFKDNVIETEEHIATWGDVVVSVFESVKNSSIDALSTVKENAVSIGAAMGEMPVVGQYIESSAKESIGLLKELGIDTANFFTQLVAMTGTTLQDIAIHGVDNLGWLSAGAARVVNAPFKWLYTHSSTGLFHESLRGAVEDEKSLIKIQKHFEDKMGGSLPRRLMNIASTDFIRDGVEDIMRSAEIRKQDFKLPEFNMLIPKSLADVEGFGKNMDVAAEAAARFRKEWNDLLDSMGKKGGVQTFEELSRALAKLEETRNVPHMPFQPFSEFGPKNKEEVDLISMLSAEASAPNIVLGTAQKHAFTSLKKRIDPAGAAVERFRKEYEMLLDAMGASGGIETFSELSTLLYKLKKSYRDVLEPQKVYQENMEEEYRLASLIGDAKAIEIASLKKIEGLKSSFGVVGPAMKERVREDTARIFMKNKAVQEEFDMLQHVDGAQKLYNKNKDTLSRLLDKGLISLRNYNKELRIQALELGLSPLKEYIKNMKEEIQVAGLLGDARVIEMDALQRINDLRQQAVEITPGLTQMVREDSAALFAKNEASQHEEQMLSQINSVQDTYNDNMKALKSLYDKALISSKQFTKAVEEQKVALLDFNKDALSGLERGLIRSKWAFNDFATVAEDAVVNSFQHIEDVLTEFFTTMKFNWKDALTSIFADINRLMVRKAITGPLTESIAGGGFGIKSLFGMASGGVVDRSLQPIPAYAQGGVHGIYSGPAMIIGEGKYNEAAIPLPDGKHVPVELKGNRRPVNINMPVTINTPDAASFGRSESRIGGVLARRIQRAQERDV